MRKLETARLAGRCANGLERGHGHIWHAVARGSWSAVCGKIPGRLSGGWCEATEGEKPTCKGCLEKLPSAWEEYDATADHLAARGLKGTEGDTLPMGLSVEALDLINDDLEAFQNRVKECAYARACEASERAAELRDLEAGIVRDGESRICVRVLEAGSRD